MATPRNSMDCGLALSKAVIDAGGADHLQTWRQMNVTQSPASKMMTHVASKYLN